MQAETRERFDRAVSADRIEQAAAFAADQLAAIGVAKVRSGQPVDGSYATDKWTAGRSELSDGWTGEVVARFLTALSGNIDALGRDR